VGLIYLDSCVMVYLVERNRDWSAALDKAIAGLGADDVLCISPIVKAECLVAPLKRKDGRLLDLYARHFDGLGVLDIDEPVWLQAAGIRARTSLKLPDALHLACAQRHGCSGLWTNDTRLHVAGGGIARALHELS
jgi:predicted nucleic acid-binding protein